MRASSYTIYVDLPGRSEEVLLVHGYTGAYDIVANDVADYLRSLDTHKLPKPLYGAWTPQQPPAFTPGEDPDEPTIAHLTRRGYLTEMTVEEEHRFLQTSANRLHLARQMFSPQFIFMPTYDCNLRCPYCFQDHMRSDARHAHLLKPMTIAMADRLIRGIETIETRHEIGPTEYERNVGFFGGEPLLRAGRPVVEHIMRRLKAQGPVQFWAVTNATELDAYLDLLGPDGIDTLQITLDGTPEEHDTRRIHADGTGSYAEIAPNIRAALERGAAVQVRVNVDRNNLSTLPQIARNAIAEGWSEFARFDLHTAPINAVNDGTDRTTTFSTRQLADALDGLRAKHPEMAVFREQDAAMKMKARQMMTGAIEPMNALKAGFCSAHDRMYILDAFADVYACWERTGDTRIRIGRITEDGDYVSNNGLEQQWRGRSAVSNPVCSKCRYVLYCGGGCAVLAEHQHGEFFSNFCDEYATRFRRRVAEAYLDHSAGRPMAAVSAPCDQ